MKLEALSTLTAQDLMTSNPICASPETTITQIADLLFASEVRHIPIVRDGELLGIVGDRELRRFMMPPGNEAAGEEVRQALASLPVTVLLDSTYPQFVTPEDELLTVVTFFVEKRVGAIPVVDDARGVVVGIISYVDVLDVCRKVLRSGEIEHECARSLLNLRNYH